MPRWLKVVLWAVAIALVVVLLFTVVFPRVERMLEDPTMAQGHGGAATSPWAAPPGLPV